MSLESVLSSVDLGSLGSVSSNYLNYDNATSKWSVIKLNCLERFIRWLGLGYGSTRLEYITSKIISKIDLGEKIICMDRGAEDLIEKIQASWEKRFPNRKSPMAQIHELGEVFNEAPKAVKIGNTDITFETGAFLLVNAECIVFNPSIPVPPLSRIHIRNVLEKEAPDFKVLEWWEPKGPSQPFLTSSGSLYNKRLKYVMHVPKPRGLPDLAYVESQMFFTECLDLAKSRGIRSIAFAPAELEQGTEMNLNVVSEYLEKNPAAFDSVKFVYNVRNLDRAIKGYN